MLNPTGNISILLFSGGSAVFIAPDYLKIEIQKHHAKLLKLFNKTETELLKATQILFDLITFYPVSIVPVNVLADAELLVADIDPNDAIYVAFALFFQAKLWSGDKVLARGLQAKGFDMIATTFEVTITILK